MGPLSTRPPPSRRHSTKLLKPEARKSLLGTYLTLARSSSNRTPRSSASMTAWSCAGVQDIAAYPVMPTRVAGIEMKWPSALINALPTNNRTCRDPAEAPLMATARSGHKYWKMRREEYEPKGIRWAVDYDCLRPRLIQIYKSSNVRLQGLTPGTLRLLDRPRLLFAGCQCRFAHLSATTSAAMGLSTDGIDVDSSPDERRRGRQRHRMQRRRHLPQGRLRRRWPARQLSHGEDPHPPQHRKSKGWASPSAARLRAVSAMWMSRAPSPCSP